MVSAFQFYSIIDSKWNLVQELISRIWKTQEVKERIENSVG